MFRSHQHPQSPIRPQVEFLSTAASMTDLLYSHTSFAAKCRRNCLWIANRRLQLPRSSKDIIFNSPLQPGDWKQNAIWEVLCGLLILTLRPFPTVQPSKGVLSLQHTIFIRHTTVAHTMKRALRSTISREAQHSAVDSCFKGIIMRATNLDLERI